MLKTLILLFVHLISLYCPVLFQARPIDSLNRTSVVMLCVDGCWCACLPASVPACVCVCFVEVWVGVCACMRVCLHLHVCSIN